MKAACQKSARATGGACLLWLVLSAASLWPVAAAASHDAGVSSPDSGPRAHDAALPAGPARTPARPAPASRPSPSTRPVDPHSRAVATLEAEIARLTKATAAMARLDANTVEVPSSLATLIPATHRDPSRAAARLLALEALVTKLEAEVRAASREARALSPLLRAPMEELARQRAERRRALANRSAALAAAKEQTRQRRRRRRVTIPPEPPPLSAELISRAALAARRLQRASLERQRGKAQLALRRAEAAFLRRSQPARRALFDRARSEALARQAQEKRALDNAQRRALAEQAAAESARRRALRAERRAATRAERILSGERARLEGVRSAQARLRTGLVGLRQALGEQRKAWRDERRRLRKELLRLGQERRPEAASDELYDRVVARLAPLRPVAREQLWTAIRGGTSTPRPAELAAALLSLQSDHGPEVQRLMTLQRDLERAAQTLAAQQQSLLHDRLVAIHEEIDGLNRQRLELLPRLSKAKRRALVSLTAPMIEQLLREVTQLVYDSLYWAYTRLRQLHQLPGWIVDIFTVGSALYRTLKVLAMLWLFAFLWRRWEPWLSSSVRGVGHSLTLGRFAVPLAKLVDTLRHAGKALLTLLFAALLYRLLGGSRGPTELSVAYELVFWIAIYRLQLRLVESLAKYAGMEEALRGAEGEELLEADDDDLEGPPVPRAVRLAQTNAERGIEASRTVPPSVLLVRSVRAATRYLLTIVLLLRLTAMAVGKGTIYGLTVELYWWAALPFVLYFLTLWRPHIARAFLSQAAEADAQAEARGKRRRRKGGDDDADPQGPLARAVSRSQNRWYGVFVIAVAFLFVLGHKLGRFARLYLTSLDATKKLLAFAFRRQVEKHAQQRGHVVHKRRELPTELVGRFPLGPLEPSQRLLEQTFWEEIREVYSNWKAERRDGSLVLMGRAGMGKTTTLRALERELGESVLRGEPKGKLTRPIKVVHWLSDVFGFSPRANSENELIERIREDRHPIVAIDNCHNLFLRKVGGFDGWEACIRIVNATCDNVLWVLAVNQAAWDYLHNASGRVHYFRRVLELPSWSEDEIRRLLMTRMRRARYRVSFSDLVVTELEGTSLSAQIGRTAQGYFRLLWDSTGGNPRLASHFWLDSLVPDGEREVRVHLFSTPPISELERLPDNIVFVLTAITEHENLSIEEVAQTTNLPHDFCAFACRFCLERGLLCRDGETQRLRLSQRWQRSVLRFLKRKHMLRD